MWPFSAEPRTQPCALYFFFNIPLYARIGDLQPFAQIVDCPRLRCCPRSDSGVLVYCPRLTVITHTHTHTHTHTLIPRFMHTHAYNIWASAHPPPPPPPRQLACTMPLIIVWLQLRCLIRQFDCRIWTSNWLVIRLKALNILYSIISMWIWSGTMYLITYAPIQTLWMTKSNK